MITVSCFRLQRWITGAKSQPTANTILSIDLSQNWTSATVLFHSTSKPNGVPNLNYGSLWYHEPTELIYTGYTGASSSLDPDSNPLPPPESIWTFKPDNLGSGTWNLTIPTNASVWDAIARTVQGYQAYGNGSAYVLGGYNWTTPGEHTILSGMIKFDMSSQTFSNISSETGATSPSGNPASYGRMQYVPYFGSNGIFVVMSGWDSNGNIGFGQVVVFDPASGSWYNQTTTGNEPAPRGNFCTAGIASTNGTYEIFVYAGGIGRGSVNFDAVNILSLPGFNWISVPYTPQNARSAHTCEAVGGNQIAIIGGFDADPPLLTSNMTSDEVDQREFSTPDPFAQGLGIFDMQTLDFADKYIAGRGMVYEASPNVTYFYTQGHSGNLVEGLDQLMKETHFPPPTSSNSTAKSPSATSSTSTANNRTLAYPSSSASNNPHTNHASAITGGVIGGFLGIALFIALVLGLSRRRRRKMQSRLSQNPAKEVGNGEAHEKDGNARAELQQPVSRLELGNGEAHEIYGNAREELGHGEAHEKDGNARVELPGWSTMY